MSFLQLRSPRVVNTLANPTPVASAYNMDALPGSYAVTGAAATFRNNRALAATAGSYVITGSASALVAQRRLTTVAGTYAITGANAQTVAQRSIAALSGSYATTGAAAFLTRGVSLNAAAGTIAVTGSPASVVAARVLATDAGAFVIIGYAAELFVGIPPVVAGGALQRFDVVYNRGVNITPSDTVNFDGSTGTVTRPMLADAVYVGVAGVLSVVLENGDVMPFTVQAGYVLPMRCIRINATSTTATQLVALYLV